MLAKRRKNLRSKVKAFRKRKLRKAVEELDDDIAALAVGQPNEQGK